MAHVNEFDRFKTDEERFKFILDNYDHFSSIPKIKTESKSSTISTIKRKAGNELYKSARASTIYVKILELYTESMAYAENDSIELAFAYGNRSALLWTVKLFDQCLLDIDRALKLNYPNNLKTKLLRRKILCMKIMHQSKFSLDDGTLVLTMNMMRDGSVTREEKLQFLKESEDTSSYEQRKLFDWGKFCPRPPRGNPEIPGASKALSVAWNKKRGRHIVATKKIYPGEVLAVQHEFASILTPEHFYTHCTNCCKQTFSSVPCLRCSQAVFCNEACREEAWKNHHDVECRVVGGLLDGGHDSLSLLSLRLLIIAVRKAGSVRALKNQVDSVASWKDPRTKGFVGEPLIFKGDDYRSVYTLNGTTESVNTICGVEITIKALMIMYYLGTMTDFLGKKMPLGSIEFLRRNTWSGFLGALLMHHQRIIPANARESGEKDDKERISLLPFWSLFNHSCCAKVTHVRYNRSVAMYALQTIKPGEEVCDNYSVPFTHEPLRSRKKLLAEVFSFDCKCQACREDWPTLEMLPTLDDLKLSMSTQRELAYVLVIMGKHLLLEPENVSELGLSDFVKDLCDMLKVLCEFVDRPCREKLELVERLRVIYVLFSTRFEKLRD